MTRLTLDGLGLVYISFTAIWTSVLFSGTCFLYANRWSPTLKIRRLPLMIPAVALLHVYWVLCMIGYVIGPVVPCQVEYFLMSIYLPFGIAVFQIANSQFLFIATQQTVFTSMYSLDDPAVVERRRSHCSGSKFRFRGLVSHLRHLDRMKQMTVIVSTAMVLEVVSTLVIYLISEKFHPGFGVIPIHLEATDGQQRVACSRGWEWWGSILWQFFWAWIYAPWLLFKSRTIRDTHGWRLQTILCCTSGLPASPLWLTGLYSDKMNMVNKVFIPPMWFAVSIFFLQLFSVFIPCYHVLTQRALQQETLNSIAAWEHRNKKFESSFISDGTTNTSALSGSDSSVQTLKAPHASRKLSSNPRKDSIFNMTALDHALKWNPEPLRKFAALQDFSGENISFLTHLGEWKRSWHSSGPQPDLLPSEKVRADAKKLRQQYNKAIRIYAAFISPHYAEFPLNLPARAFYQLQDLFERPTALLYGSREKTTNNEIAPFAFPDEVDKAALVSASELDREDLVWYWGPVPEEFSKAVFEVVEKEIRYLVLTNTWPKFVDDGYSEWCKVSLWQSVKQCFQRSR